MTNPLTTALKATDTLFEGIDQLLTGASVSTSTFERMMQDVDMAHAARSKTYRHTYLKGHIHDAAMEIAEREAKTLERMGKSADFEKLYLHNIAELEAVHAKKEA